MWSELFVNASTREVVKQPVPDALNGFGGRSLIANYIMGLVKAGKMGPKCDPLGPQNPLLLCNGVFAGTAFSTANRLSIGCKSPLTGTIKESSAGGTFAKHMADHGIRVISVHGLPEDDKLHILHILADGSAVFEDAEYLRNAGTYEVVETLMEKYGDKVSIACIGPAGEKRYKAASIHITEFRTGHPCRVAARGGIGSLMGAKGLKAIVIDKAEKKYEIEYADPEMFRKYCTETNKLMLENAQNSYFHTVGTVSIIDGSSKDGVLPVENFSGEMMAEAGEELGSASFLERLAKRGGCNQQPCQPGCVVRCSNVYNDKDGNYLTSGFEYETLGLFGPNCRILDMDKIAMMDRMCDDIGVDTIEMGTAMGVAMECGKLPWGDADGAIAILEEVRTGTEFGRLFGDGCEAVGKALGCEHIPTVKHQSLSAYDPRNSKGTAIGYALSPMGADHTSCNTYGYQSFGDSTRGTALYVANKLMVGICFSDSMMCLFAFSQVSSRLDLLLGMYVGMYGGEMDLSRITTDLGAKILLTERKFNELAGFTEEDDKLPSFFTEEVHQGTGETFDILKKEMDTMFRF